MGEFLDVVANDVKEARKLLTEHLGSPLVLTDYECRSFFRDSLSVLPIMGFAALIMTVIATLVSGNALHLRPNVEGIGFVLGSFLLFTCATTSLFVCWMRKLRVRMLRRRFSALKRLRQLYADVIAIAQEQGSPMCAQLEAESLILDQMDSEVSGLSRFGISFRDDDLSKADAILSVFKEEDLDVSSDAVKALADINRTILNAQRELVHCLPENASVRPIAIG